MTMKIEKDLKQASRNEFFRCNQVWFYSRGQRLLLPIYVCSSVAQGGNPTNGTCALESAFLMPWNQSIIWMLAAERVTSFFLVSLFSSAKMWLLKSWNPTKAVSFGMPLEDTRSPNRIVWDTERTKETSSNFDGVVVGWEWTTFWCPESTQRDTRPERRVLEHCEFGICEPVWFILVCDALFPCQILIRKNKK